MLVVYTSPGCSSCRKVKAWLKERNIAFTEKNLFTMLLNEKEIRYLFERSENGSEDLISVHCKYLSENHINVEELTLSQLVELIQRNPSIMKRPIILNEKNMVIGYDADEMSVFEGELKNQLEHSCAKEKCPNYALCAKVRE